MTILRPNYEKKERFWKVTRFIGGAAVLSALIPAAVTYSNLVSVKYEVSRLEKSISNERVRNAEIKSRLFYAIDPGRVGEVAMEKGLVEEKSPRWIFASL